MIMVKEKLHPEDHTKDKLSLTRELILHNDDFNTFDFVIDTLIEVCDHEPEQAEQCAMVTHYNGKCAVRSGDHSFLKPMYDEMLRRGLTVSID